MKFKENRPLAWILVSILLVLSLVISASTSLSSKKNKLDSLFYESINDDLNTKSAYADNMAGVASRYLDRNSSYITNMAKAREDLLNAKNVKDKYRASAAITNAASALYDVLGSMDITETDDRLRRSNYADILAVDDIIKRSNYNKAVDEFNTELSKFPARLVSFVQPADYFR